LPNDAGAETNLTMLIVQLPPCPFLPTAASNSWEGRLPALRFILFDRQARVLRTGKAMPALLPKAHSTIVLVAARDLLMLTIAVPPLKGRRLQQALPNLVEDYLLQDPGACHIAIDPLPTINDAGNTRTLAVVNRSWFRFIRDTFIAAGHRNLRVIPFTYCLPEPVATEGTASGSSLLAVVLNPAETDQEVELVLKEEGQNQSRHIGLTLPAHAFSGTFNALTVDKAVTLYQLTDTPDSASVPVDHINAKTVALSFETLARRALDCRFDLCQFDFAPEPWYINRTLFKHWRIPISLIIATLLVTLVGTNLQWWQYARQRHALAAAQAKIFIEAFPKVTPLDPPRQMARQLDILRLAAGMLSPDDFLSLLSRFVIALGENPKNTISAINYRDHMLEVHFKPEAKIDVQFRQRLAENKLDGQLSSENKQQWTIRSRP
jgi:general secretion pathway protein L